MRGKNNIPVAMVIQSRAGFLWLLQSTPQAPPLPPPLRFDRLSPAPSQVAAFLGEPFSNKGIQAQKTLKSRLADELSTGGHASFMSRLFEPERENFRRFGVNAAE